MNREAGTTEICDLSSFRGRAVMLWHDEFFQRKSRARMMELMGGGTTVLFVTHSLDQIRTMCSRVVWLDHGQIKIIGECNEVCDAYHLAMS